MEVTNKAGYDALQDNYDLLKKAIDPSDVVDLCFQRKLVSQEQMAEIGATRETKGRYRSCSKLLQAVMSNGSEGVFQTFLEILETKKDLKYLAERLRG